MLVTPADDLHEFSRVDRAEAVTAPCVLLSKHDPVLEFRFSWDTRATDLMYLATDPGAVSNVTAPRYVENFPAKMLVGVDGAISQTACVTKGGRYFTLTLQLPQVQMARKSRRDDIEKFMRAYFPATVKTLDCA
ncbi:hypothetical protein [Streptomyces cellostaticus]|uniref:hypothetical protein n=1 Tax=Streptomyces cellostaticus TaxID=67285 RepID=UPI002026F290|nr:hypothetical protein [Streptomyces cellostaticus]